MELRTFLNEINTLDIPQLESGKSNTIKEFYETCIEKNLPNEKVICQWDKLLDEYVQEASSILFVRRYSSAPKKRWEHIRRGFLTMFDDGFGYVFCDNFLAHYFFTMALSGFVPKYKDFKATILQRQFPYGYMETSAEIPFRAYPKGKNPKLNNAGWKLAHLFSVNQKDYSFDYRGEVEDLFPRGEQADWVRDPRGNYPVRKFSHGVSEEDKLKMVAHFLRLVHPINHFLVPMRKFENDDYNNDIGEKQELINYVYYNQKKKYPAIYEKFEKDAMVNEKSITNLQDIENTVINIEYGKNIKNKGTRSSKNTRKVTVENTKFKKGERTDNSQIAKCYSDKFLIKFEGEKIEQFKEELLKAQKAYITEYYNDGSRKVIEWDARKFAPTSNLTQNIRSKTNYRPEKRKELGIRKLFISLSDPRKIEVLNLEILKEKENFGIGRLVEKSIHELVAKELLSEEQVKFLTDKEFCKETLGIYYPLLKEVEKNQPVKEQIIENNYPRYYAKPVRVGDKNYLICNHLFDTSKNKYFEWLGTLK